MTSEINSDELPLDPQPVRPEETILTDDDGSTQTTSELAESRFRHRNTELLEDLSRQAEELRAA